MAQKRITYQKKSLKRKTAVDFTVKYFWFGTDFDVSTAHDTTGSKPFIDQFYRGYLARYEQESGNDYHLADTEWSNPRPKIIHGDFYVDRPVITHPGGGTTTPPTPPPPPPPNMS